MSRKSPAKDSLKVIFDTNIYISAFLKSGFSRELFNLAIKGKIKVFCSPVIIFELENKLQNKFTIKKSDIQLFSSTIAKIGEIVKPEQQINIIKIDPKDNIILECALAARANLIISLDKHLLKIKKFQNIGIIHPKTLRWIAPDLFGDD